MSHNNSQPLMKVHDYPILRSENSLLVLVDRDYLISIIDYLLWFMVILIKVMIISWD